MGELRESAAVMRTDRVGRAAELLRLERAPTHRTPAPVTFLAAAAIAIIGSLVGDWLLAKLAVAVFPSTRGYQHFQFGDYSTLTVLGVVAASAAWPLVVRFCREPRWLFVRLAVAVSGVGLLPDVAILVQGQPARAVLFLVFMHLLIAVVTYIALVRLAPPRRVDATG